MQSRTPKAFRGPVPAGQGGLASPHTTSSGRSWLHVTEAQLQAQNTSRVVPQSVQEEAPIGNGSSGPSDAVRSPPRPSFKNGATARRASKEGGNLERRERWGQKCQRLPPVTLTQRPQMTMPMNLGGKHLNRGGHGGWRWKDPKTRVYPKEMQGSAQIHGAFQRACCAKGRIGTGGRTAGSCPFSETELPGPGEKPGGDGLAFPSFGNRHSWNHWGQSRGTHRGAAPLGKRPGF